MWRELTEEDILSVLSEPEKAGYQDAATGGGQDPMQDAITTVVNQCRGYIADNPTNSLAEGLTLPERCHLSALHMIRVEMLTRLDLEVSDARRDANRAAIRFFERVAKGDVAIESPDGPIENTGSTPRLDTLVSRERIATRDSMKGL